MSVLMFLLVVLMFVLVFVLMLAQLVTSRWAAGETRVAGSLTGAYRRPSRPRLAAEKEEDDGKPYRSEVPKDYVPIVPVIMLPVAEARAQAAADGALGD